MVVLFLKIFGVSRVNLLDITAVFLSDLFHWVVLIINLVHELSNKLFHCNFYHILREKLNQSLYEELELPWESQK